MKTDNTEELLNEETPVKSNKLKTKTIWIIGGIALLIVIVIGAYFIYRNFKYNSEINKGINYLTDGNYDQSINLFNNALSINDKKVEAYNYKILAAQSNGNYYLAEQTLEQRNEAIPDSTGNITLKTENKTYELDVDRFEYGNSNGNINNNGFVVQQFNKDYIIYKDGENNKAQVLEIDNSNATKIYDMDWYSDDYINSINAWGDKIYFYTETGFKTYNIFTEKISDFEISELNLNDTTLIYPIIYKGAIYCLKASGSVTHKETIAKIDLKTRDVEEIYVFQGADGFIEDFIVLDDNVFCKTRETKGVTIYKVAIDGSSEENFYSIPAPNGFSNGTPKITSSENFIFLLDNNADNTIEQRSITRLDITNGEAKKIVNSNLMIASINSDEENIYYLIDNILYRCNFEGENITEVYRATGQAANLSFYMDMNGIETVYDYINITNNSIFLDFTGYENISDSTWKNPINLYFKINKEDYSDVLQLKPKV